MHAVIKVLFKCEHCGACCRITRAYTASDVEGIQAYTHESTEEITEKLERQTCGYLVDNLCSVHFAKPRVCSWWPGPGTESCPGYKKLMDAFWKPGTMHRICNEPELGELYTKCLLQNDILAARDLLKRLDIEV